MSAVFIATSVAASSAASTASNSARIAQQRKEECILFVEGFDSRNSTIVEQKNYASCVQLLNPEPMTANETTGAKVCVAALLIAFVVGLIFGWKDDGLIGMLFWGIMAPLALVMLGILLIAVFLGLVFLINGA